jgi:hypothetical protein
MKFIFLALSVLSGSSRASRLAFVLRLLKDCFVLGLLAGCSKKGFDESSLGPPEVLVTDVVQQDVPIIREWIGSLDGSVNADIRARVVVEGAQRVRDGQTVKPVPWIAPLFPRRNNDVGILRLPADPRDRHFHRDACCRPRGAGVFAGIALSEHHTA